MKRFGIGQASGRGISRPRLAGPKITAEQQQKCARCGAMKWFHEPGRVLVPDHEFTTVWRPWAGRPTDDKGAL